MKIQKALISLLQENSRRPIFDLGKQLGLGHAAS
jgi:DNA-binding Lrp family transcriptional regulator